MPLRQSYLRLAKRAAIMVGRPIPTLTLSNALGLLKFVWTRLARLSRDIRRRLMATQC